MSKPPQIQMKISRGLPNPEANQLATTQVARYIIDTGKPLWTVEDPLFRRMCLSFRAVGSDYRFPGRKQLTNEYLPAHSQARRQDTYSKLAAEAEVFGLAMFGDGATIRKMPLINILASGAHCSSGLLEIVDCTKHHAAGGSKTAEYIAGLMKPHVEKLGPK